MKWLRYCFNAKNYHQRHHLYPTLNPGMVVLDPKCSTIIKISSFYKPFTGSSNLRSVFFLGPLVDLFHQNVPPEVPHVLAVKIGSGGFRPQVWHQYQGISILKTFYCELKFEVRSYHQRRHLYQPFKSL